VQRRLGLRLTEDGLVGGLDDETILSASPPSDGAAPFGDRITSLIVATASCDAT
jgi:hypothetical protein